MRNWKVGSITGGVLLIGIGVLWLAQYFIPLPFARIMLYAWPFICIFLGAEILFLHFRNKEEPLRIHLPSIVLLVFIGGASLLFNMAQVALNEFGFSLSPSTHQVNETFTPENQIEKIVLTMPQYDLTITGTEEENIQVIGSVQSEFRDVEALEEQFQQSFSIQQIGTRVFIDMRDISHFAHTSGLLHIAIPADVELEVNNGFRGTVRATNVNSNANFQMGDSYVRVSQLNSSLNIDYLGDISVQNSLLSDNSFIHAQGGSIILQLAENQNLAIDGSATFGRLLGNVAWNITEESNQTSGEVVEDDYNEEYSHQGYWEEDYVEYYRGTAQVGEGNENTLQLVTTDGSITVNE